MYVSALKLAYEALTEYLAFLQRHLGMVPLKVLQYRSRIPNEVSRIDNIPGRCRQQRLCSFICRRHHVRVNSWLEGFQLALRNLRTFARLTSRSSIRTRMCVCSGFQFITVTDERSSERIRSFARGLVGVDIAARSPAPSSSLDKHYFPS